MVADRYESDLQETLANRERLRSNGNLMYWYDRLYQHQFAAEPKIGSARILEIGSGTSPLKHFAPNVTTSDVLPLDHVDLVFDCHAIEHLEDIDGGSIDIMTMTNVLHHLKDPLAFLRAAAVKLAPGARVYMTEPYFSVMSYPMYKLLHHEPVDFRINRPILETVEGPLSSSNQAIPHMIFFSRPDWLDEISDVYDMGKTSVTYFTGISYPMTGGISRRFPVPASIYRAAFAIDYALSKWLPKLCASFFVARLVARK
jgi:SAM-dependent methyltransferase